VRRGVRVLAVNTSTKAAKFTNKSCHGDTEEGLNIDGQDEQDVGKARS
jgi:hypothetical protein